ncbi:hypothetical protein BKA70DRAFT_256824 [Coprinopsis sp. MPI-PUGE-AT-0042]|nr:hypothetical protein BKA70DRAFT_256824 [Coprinopsis sp. MPI-PUGE-AT-0042]
MSNPNTPEESNVTLGLTADADSQPVSSLFTVFPPEIRAEIFSLALRSFSDASNTYPFDSYWYRPGYTAPKQTGLSLGNDEEAFWWGSNDRRPRDHGGTSYLDGYDPYDFDGTWIVDSDDGGDGGSVEASSEELESDGLEDGIGDSDDAVDEGFAHQGESNIHLQEVQGLAVVSMVEGSHGTPISTAEPSDSDRHIEGFLAHSLADVTRLLSNSPLQSNRQVKFTSRHWSKIRSIHIFPQMYALSSRAFVRTFIQAKGLRPHIVKLTVRYTDWWYWEENVPLHLSSLVPERNAYYFPESVDTLLLELESAEHKKSELEEMVKDVVHDKKVWR